MEVAEQAYGAGQVVEVPARPVQGDDGGVEVAADRLLVVVNALAAGGGDQGYVAFGRGESGGVPVDQDQAAPTDMRLAGCGSPWVMTRPPPRRWLRPGGRRPRRAGRDPRCGSPADGAPVRRRGRRPKRGRVEEEASRSSRPAKLGAGGARGPGRQGWPDAARRSCPAPGRAATDRCTCRTGRNGRQERETQTAYRSSTRRSSRPSQAARGATTNARPARSRSCGGGAQGTPKPVEYRLPRVTQPVLIIKIIDRDETSQAILAGHFSVVTAPALRHIVCQRRMKVPALGQRRCQAIRNQVRWRASHACEPKPRRRRTRPVFRTSRCPGSAWPGSVPTSPSDSPRPRPAIAAQCDRRLRAQVALSPI